MQLLAGGREPAPVQEKHAVGTVEEGEAVRVDIRETGVAARIDPRRISHPDRSLAIVVRVGGFECYTPLAFGNRSVRRELLPHLIQVGARADAHQLEAAGLDARPLFADELPLLWLGVAVTQHHLDRVGLGRIEVERELKLHAVSRVLR